MNSTSPELKISLSLSLLTLYGLGNIFGAGIGAGGIQRTAADTRGRVYRFSGISGLPVACPGHAIKKAAYHGTPPVLTSVIN